MRNFLANPRLLLFIAPIAGFFQGLSIAPGWALPQLFALAVLFTLFWVGQSKKIVASAGFLFGLGWFCTSISWVFVSIHTYGNQPVWFAALGTVLFAAYLSIYPALAGFISALYKGVRKQSCLWQFFLLVCPAAWGLSEWLRGWILSGFPWAATAYAHLDGPLAVFAPVVGAVGINYLAALTAGLGCCLVYGFVQRKLILANAAAVLFLILLGGAFALRGAAWSEPAGQINFRLLQAGIDQSQKFSLEGLRLASDFYLKELNSPDLKKGTVAVLPETVFPFPVMRSSDSPESFFVKIAREKDISIIFGGFLFNQDRKLGNASILIKSDGTFSRYFKKHLVPFGEFVPFGFRWFIDMLAIPMADLAAGNDGQDMFVIDGLSMAPTLCYEDLFAEGIRGWWNRGTSPSVLINLSNLSWFGDSLVLPQHLGISRLRAMEFSRPVVRATNTGATAAIDAKGKVIARLPYIAPGRLDVTVTATMGSPTPYARYGDLPSTCWMLLMLALSTLISYFSKKD